MRSASRCAIHSARSHRARTSFALLWSPISESDSTNRRQIGDQRLARKSGQQFGRALQGRGRASGAWVLQSSQTSWHPSHSGQRLGRLTDAMAHGIASGIYQRLETRACRCLWLGRDRHCPKHFVYGPTMWASAATAIDLHRWLVRPTVTPNDRCLGHKPNGQIGKLCARRGPQMGQSWATGGP